LKLSVVHRAVDPAGLAGLAGLPPVLARAYAARGIEDPSQLAHAVDLLLAHRRVEGRVLVVGDFDADGATSSALIVRALQAWGWPAVDFLVPNRFEYGYGLTPEIVALAAERAPTLIVTVDNGISSITGVAAARARGIEVLVTDHHLAGAELPDANVIVNPNVPGATSVHALSPVWASRST
jgi:single-stranded-DNA-specific exonuclease